VNVYLEFFTASKVGRTEVLFTHNLDYRVLELLLKREIFTAGVKLIYELLTPVHMYIGTF
jgi:hypothetical protein